MAATISQTGTWTSITAQPGIPKTGPNSRRGDGLNLTAFNSERTRTATPDFPELVQFIQLVADAYSLAYQPAALFVHHMLAMHINRASPTNAREFTP